MSIYVAGLDLGQTQDYTGLVIIEAKGTDLRVPYEGVHPELGLPTTEWLHVETPPIVSLDVRHIERFALNTKYSQIALEMAQRLRGMPQPRYFALDQTGVGMGVFEMMANLRPIGITITGGNDTQMLSPQQFRVPKRDLMASLQVPFQNGIIRIAKGLPHAALLMRELQNFRVKISSNGRDTYEAWREADHDDLVLAAGIAAWLSNAAFEFRQSQAAQWLEQQQIRPYSISPV
jgi:hypothetical protein